MFREAAGDLPILAVLGNHDHWNREIYAVSHRRIPYAKYPHLRGYGAMKQQWQQWAEEYNITLLEDSPWITDEVAVFGFNGWYNDNRPNTNDIRFMPKVVESAPINQYLRHNAQKQIDYCLERSAELKLENPKQKQILVTHMPSYTIEPFWEFMCANLRWMDYIAEEFDVYCVGHSHNSEDFIHTTEDKAYTVRCINAGTFKEKNSGYDAPRFKVFEV